jgi:hypothetical protein
LKIASRPRLFGMPLSLASRPADVFGTVQGDGEDVSVLLDDDGGLGHLSTSICSRYSRSQRDPAAHSARAPTPRAAADEIAVERADVSDRIRYEDVRYRSVHRGEIPRPPHR